jgi:hypothetical protein
MLTVFQPINDEMLSVITKNADLLIDKDMPPELKAFCAHVVVYKVVFEKWKANDFSEYTSIANYPAKEMEEYLKAAFLVVKKRQTKLLGSQAKEVDEEFEAVRSQVRKELAKDRGG